MTITIRHTIILLYLLPVHRRLFKPNLSLIFTDSVIDLIIFIIIIDIQPAVGIGKHQQNHFYIKKNGYLYIKKDILLI